MEERNFIPPVPKKSYWRKKMRFRVRVRANFCRFCTKIVVERDLWLKEMGGLLACTNTRFQSVLIMTNTYVIFSS